METVFLKSQSFLVWELQTSVHQQQTDRWDRWCTETHWLDRTTALLPWWWWWWRCIFPLCCCSSRLLDSFYRLFADQRFWTKTLWTNNGNTDRRKESTCVNVFFWCFKSINKLSNFFDSSSSSFEPFIFLLCWFYWRTGGDALLSSTTAAGLTVRFSHLQTDIW